MAIINYKDGLFIVVFCGGYLNKKVKINNMFELLSSFFKNSKFDFSNH